MAMAPPMMAPVSSFGLIVTGFAGLDGATWRERGRSANAEAKRAQRKATQSTYALCRDEAPARPFRFSAFSSPLRWGRTPLLPLTSPAPDANHADERPHVAPLR